MKYDTMVFDLDGTLLDTLDDLTDSVNFIMDNYGYEKKTIGQVRDYVGNGAARLIELCIPQGLENSNFSEILSNFKQYYAQNCRIKTKPYKTVPEVLSTLKEKGIKMSVVSNKPDIAVKSLCADFFGEYIQTALGEAGNDTKKPSPKLVLDSLLLLDTPKEKAVYIGDSEVDILTARNAGINCITVSWGFRNTDFLLEFGADPIIDYPYQLLDYI